MFEKETLNLKAVLVLHGTSSEDLDRVWRTGYITVHASTRQHCITTWKLNTGKLSTRRTSQPHLGCKHISTCFYLLKGSPYPQASELWESPCSCMHILITDVGKKYKQIFKVALSNQVIIPINQKGQNFSLNYFNVIWLLCVLRCHWNSRMVILWSLFGADY